MANKRVVKTSKLDYYLINICGDAGHHIFIKEADNAYFLSLLEKLLIENKTVELAAYCLKSDQIILLSNQIKGGGVADLMHNIVTNYNNYYFVKYAVEDVLSEGECVVSTLLAEDVLKASCKIHTSLDDWINYEYSSLRAYLYNDTPNWLTRRHISDLYGSAVKYFDFLNNIDENNSLF